LKAAIDASGRLRCDAAEVSAVKERLLVTLEALGRNGDGVSDTAREALQAALEGGEGEGREGSAPLLERLVGSATCASSRHFATDAEVMLAAAAYDVCVCVHQPLGRRLTTYLPDLSVIDGLSEDACYPAVHLLCTGDHFDALDQAA
jgi:hypothetical protein